MTITGSQIDQNYYRDVYNWTIGGQRINVTEDNDHVGQIISGDRQEQKNIDLRLEKGRKSLFALLGTGFSFKCLLSPVLKLHLWRTFISPVITSGLATFVLKPTTIEPLYIFQKKTLKSLLRLSIRAPTPAIHFVCAELPVEGKSNVDLGHIFVRSYLF